jgi:ribosomal protein S18 acetylase RimI-like enzyme
MKQEATMQIAVSEGGARARIDIHTLSGDAYISDVFVPIGTRGKGKGTEIVEKCLKICSALRVRVVVCHTSPKNVEMVRVLEKCRFEEGEQEVHFSFDISMMHAGKEAKGAK